MKRNARKNELYASDIAEIEREWNEHFEYNGAFKLQWIKCDQYGNKGRWGMMFDGEECGSIMIGTETGTLYPVIAGNVYDDDEDNGL